MSERDDTKQLIADAESLRGEKATTKGTESTRELVDSAERVLGRGQVDEPDMHRISPIPLLVVGLIVLILAVIGIYSAVGSAL